jgi:osmoprotectant transport system ATP-binding protein
MMDGQAISAAMSLREALSEFVARQTEQLPVVDAMGQRIGVLHFGDLVKPVGEGGSDVASYNR